MKINCQCGKRLSISQKEVNRNAVIRCTGCGRVYELKLVDVTDEVKERVKNNSQFFLVNK